MRVEKYPSYVFMLAMLMIVVLLSGCNDTRSALANLSNGGPMIDDSVWFMTSTNTGDVTRPDYLPIACDTQKNTVKIDTDTCVETMLNVIDVRYRRWIESLNSSVSWTNAGVDTAVIGMGAAGSLVGGVTSQILGATVSALTGTKKAVDNDVLYNTTVPVLILQMDKDRNCWGSVIQMRLKDKGYSSLAQAFNDLIAYDAAGSFVNAVRSLQAQAGAGANATKTTLQASKAGNSTTNENANPPTCGVNSTAAPSAGGSTITAVYTVTGSETAAQLANGVATAVDIAFSGAIANANGNNVDITPPGTPQYNWTATVAPATTGGTKGETISPPNIKVDGTVEFTVALVGKTATKGDKITITATPVPSGKLTVQSNGSDVTGKPVAIAAGKSVSLTISGGKTPYNASAVTTTTAGASGSDITVAKFDSGGATTVTAMGAAKSGTYTFTVTDSTTGTALSTTVTLTVP